MPLFNRPRRRGADSASPVNGQRAGSDSSGEGSAGQERRADSPARPKLVFHCQLAHGSPTGIISGFTNVKELYQKIADCYDMPVSEILFCTLNTHKLDMSKLLGGQIGLEDFIFAHKKGQAKEIEIVKTEQALGLTITDNGAGYAFIKRVKEGSVMARIPHVQVGDHIEKIDGVSLVGNRHYEVAKRLKDIPVDKAFLLRVVEPLKAGFANIGPRSDPRAGKKAGYGSGKATLRLRANGPARLEDAPTDMVEAATNKINSLLESFLGINDSELATQIWELGESKANTMEFAEAIDGSDLEAFGFTDDFVIELWGAITDVKAGRVK
ncbi:PDZ domain-containing protein GIPC3-like [Pollicipes pollicipes]|uniref:PDZ domain-containing protein GIPC3-like n=1 Tax=Pollicipes pollicipes TaxID=41117 RepID=UPI001885962A|nr:PDZ domain-containing protein GIPC3-like [Pollicipes pollicipes]